MQSAAIKQLREAVSAAYGPNSVVLYGSAEDDEHSLGFMISGIPATFSVHTQDGRLADGRYDIQIESFPPGSYVYTNVVSLGEFMTLVAKVAGPTDEWPSG